MEHAHPSWTMGPLGRSREMAATQRPPHPAHPSEEGFSQGKSLTTSLPPAYRGRIRIDRIEVGSAQLYDRTLIDTSARWSTDPDVAAEVHYRIEAAIRQGCNSICNTNDSGERVAVTWDIEKGPGAKVGPMQVCKLYRA